MKKILVILLALSCPCVASTTYNFSSCEALLANPLQNIEQVERAYRQLIEFTVATGVSTADFSEWLESTKNNPQKLFDLPIKVPSSEQRLILQAMAKLQRYIDEHPFNLKVLSDTLSALLREKIQNSEHSDLVIDEREDAGRHWISKLEPKIFSPEHFEILPELNSIFTSLSGSLWDGLSRNRLWTIEDFIPGTIRKFIVSKDKKLLAALDLNLTKITIYDLKNGHILGELDERAQAVSSFDISPDGTKVVALNRFYMKQGLHMWNISNPGAYSYTAHFSVEHPERIWFPSNDRFVIADRDCIYVFDAKTFKELFKLPHGVDFVLSPDMQFTLIQQHGINGQVFVNHWKDGKRAKNLDGSYLSSNKSGALVATLHNSNIKLWRVKDSTLLWSFPLTSKYAVRAVAWSPDGEQLVIADKGKSITVLRISDGKEIAMLSFHNDDVYGVDFTADGQTLIIAGSPVMTVEWKKFLEEEAK